MLFWMKGGFKTPLFAQLAEDLAAFFDFLLLLLLLLLFDRPATWAEFLKESAIYILAARPNSTAMHIRLPL